MRMQTIRIRKLYFFPCTVRLCSDYIKGCDSTFQQ